MSWLHTLKIGVLGALPAVSSYVLLRALRDSNTFVFCLCCGRTWETSLGNCPTGCALVFSTVFPPGWAEDQDIRKALLHRFVTKVGEGEDEHYGIKNTEGYAELYNFWLRFLDYGEDFILEDDLHNARAIPSIRAEMCSRDLHRAIRPPESGDWLDDESLMGEEGLKESFRPRIGLGESPFEKLAQKVDELLVRLARLEGGV